MPTNLIVVESPAKAKTMSKYLGKDFTCLASYGHVRDLIPKQGAVETENDFGMKYQLIEKNKKHVDAIVKAMKKADALYLATDPDREGEAISWHVRDVLKRKKALEGVDVKRVTFNAITKQSVLDAVAHPRELAWPVLEGDGEVLHPAPPSGPSAQRSTLTAADSQTGGDACGSPSAGSSIARSTGASS